MLRILGHEAGQLLQLLQLLLLINHSFQPLLNRVQYNRSEKISANQGFQISSSSPLAQICRQAIREMLVKQILHLQYQLA